MRANIDMADAAKVRAALGPCRGMRMWWDEDERGRRDDGDGGFAKQRVAIVEQITRAQSKLCNEGFLSKAPAEVIKAERGKLARLRTELDALDVHRA